MPTIWWPSGGVGKGLAEAMAELRQTQAREVMKTSLRSFALVAAAKA
jgi:hypothetical protein